MRCASAKSTGLMEIISIVEVRCGAAGTMIIVATRRNDANTDGCEVTKHKAIHIPD